jgi:uncharacterized protein (TIGR03663 family)
MSGDDAAEAPGRGDGPADGRGRRRLPGDVDPVVAGVVLAAAVALLARVAWLGARSFHWDEARVGYWTLRYLATGAFGYRPVAGGPFLYVVGRLVLGVLPASDATARLVVALLGGLLPGIALLYRDRLGDLATVLLAVLLATTPLLVYYSRFLRGDVPLAAFGLAAVALFASGLATGESRRLVAGVAAAALAVTASGFVVGYVGCWVAAGLAVLDHGRFRDGPRPDRQVRALLARFDAPATAARSLLAGLAVVVAFFAPRPDLWSPSRLPAAVAAATVGSARSFVGVRVVSRRADGGAHEFLPYLVGHAEVLVAAAGPLLVLAVVGTFVDRYRAGGPTPVVAFHAYWGLAGLLVFPVVTEVNAPWVAVHTVAPLTVPAAVGAAALLRVGTRAWTRGDEGTAAGVALLAVAALAVTGGVLADDVYGPGDRDNPLVQYAQPEDLDGLVANATAAAAGNDGVDVLYYGGRLTGTYGDDQPPVADAWGERLPLPWYFEREGLETAGAVTEQQVAATAPPVVVTVPEEREAVASALGEGYVADSYRTAVWNREVVVFVRAA